MPAHSLADRLRRYAERAMGGMPPNAAEHGADKIFPELFAIAVEIERREQIHAQMESHMWRRIEAAKRDAYAYALALFDEVQSPQDIRLAQQALEREVERLSG